MITTMTTDLELLRTRVTGAIGGQMPGQIERLSWPAGRLVAWQRDRLRTLLARAIEHSPFHAARLRGIDPSRFELADLPRLPVMTKAEMMENFDAVATDRRLTRDAVERHLAGSVDEPSLLFGDYVCLVSGGSSGIPDPADRTRRRRRRGDRRRPRRDRGDRRRPGEPAPGGPGRPAGLPPPGGRARP
jgi:phenylacetate-CoA ligase